MKKIKIRPALTSMEIGEQKDFPIERMKSVRVQASELSIIHGREYKTATNRETRVITVTRIA